MTSIRDLDLSIRRRHLLTHPFYVAWRQGGLSREELREYAGQYYRFEREFPRYVAGAYAQLREPERRRILLENLWDEEGRDPTHPELWLRFSEGLGQSRRRTVRASPTSRTRRLLSTYERLTQGRGVARALGALYAYESIFPEVAAEKSRGLRDHYGVRAPSAHEFFRVHTAADREHAAAERRLLSSELRSTPQNGEVALDAVNRTVDAWWGFLDQFCH